MSDETKPTRKPDYVGDGIALWKNIDKNKKLYLSVKVLGGKPINCFKNEPKAVNQDGL